MQGIGIDIIELSRMSDIIERSGEVFLRRAFTAAEIQRSRLVPNSVAFFASAFAVKEAVFKALVLDWDRGIDLRDIEVGRGRQGEPVVRLNGGVEAAAEAKGCRKVLVSLSYAGDIAVAMALAV
jgi:holo-[acyl-carrier protein] synthase